MNACWYSSLRERTTLHFRVATLAVLTAALLVPSAHAWGQTTAAPQPEPSAPAQRPTEASPAAETTGSGADTAFALPRVTNTAFLPGEKLTYILRYGWFTAGEAVFSVEQDQPMVNNRPTFHLRGTGRSMATFDVFYTVRDDFDSWVDQDALYPYRYVRKVHEGSIRFTDEVRFDHRNRVITGGKGTFKPEGLVHDLMSALYYARCAGLKGAPVGQFIPVPVFLDDKIYPLGFAVIGREVVKVRTGTFRCIVISPKVVTGTVFSDKNSLKIWVTDDDNLVPVKIYSPLVVGNVNAELTRFENLRNPITAAVIE